LYLKINEFCGKFGLKGSKTLRFKVAAAVLHYLTTKQTYAQTHTETERGIKYLPNQQTGQPCRPAR